MSFCDYCRGHTYVYTLTARMTCNPRNVIPAGQRCACEPTSGCMPAIPHHHPRAQGFLWVTRGGGMDVDVATQQSNALQHLCSDAPQLLQVLLGEQAMPAGTILPVSCAVCKYMYGMTVVSTGSTWRFGCPYHPLDARRPPLQQLPVSLYSFDHQGQPAAQGA